MSALRFPAPAEVGYDDYDPDGKRSNGYTTEAVPRGGFLGQAIAQLVAKEIGREYLGAGDLLMTTEACWSGYSEYTITNQWAEITVTVPSVQFEKTWESMGLFFRALADANPEADRD